MSKKKEETTKGLVVEALPNAQFKVELEDGKVVRAYMSGKMKMHRIKVLIGDTVEMVMDSYGDNNRIVLRCKQ